MPQTTDFSDKTYIAIVQCHIVAERCPGFFCERSFHARTGGFAGLAKEKMYRVLHITCGGCCGRALHRKLSLLAQKAQKHDEIPPSQILVKFASCITKESYHGPKCPHLDYLVNLVDKLGLDYSFDTHISAKAEQRREEGLYEQ
jgi:predicted metal-binding protein